MATKRKSLVVIKFSNDRPSCPGWYFYRKDKRYKKPAGWDFVEVFDEDNRLWMRSNTMKGCSFGVDICRGQFSKNIFGIK